MPKDIATEIAGLRAEMAVANAIALADLVRRCDGETPADKAAAALSALKIAHRIRTKATES
jgi:hypothetical protein